MALRRLSRHMARRLLDTGNRTASRHHNLPTAPQLLHRTAHRQLHMEPLLLLHHRSNILHSHTAQRRQHITTTRRLRRRLATVLPNTYSGTPTQTPKRCARR